MLAHPLEAASLVGYLPEERGLYPSMAARDAIAFMGALRGMPLREGRRRAEEMLERHGIGQVAGWPKVAGDRGSDRGSVAALSGSGS